MSIYFKNDCFDIRQTFLCGQCFRWKEKENGSFTGIAYGKRLTLTQTEDGIAVSGITEDELPLWRSYFDLDTDYSAFIKRFSADETLKRACGGSPGIRILRQEPFETLISFIISQNNNIPRISGIIDRLCENFGEKIGDNSKKIGDNSKKIGNNSKKIGDKNGNTGGFAFPTARQLDSVTAEDLAPLRAGFRARYIADAVEKVNSGTVDFAEIDALPLDKARERLKLITGVGDKVADCVLLFAFHKLDAFPKDVWVKRLMSEFYPDGLPDCTKGAEGVAQQYLFDYVRNNNGLVKN